MKKRKSFGIAVGGSSIILIFIVLSLTTFATLSLVSASSDYKLTRQMSDSTKLYYDADSIAESRLSDIDTAAVAAAADAADAEQFKTTFLQSKPFEYTYEELEDGTLQITYSVSVGDRREIQVELGLRYDPAADRKVSVARRRWQLLSTVTEGYGEENINLIPVD